MLYRIFNKVFILSTIKRQENKSEEDAQFKEMLIRLRNCKCTENDAKLLQTRTSFLVQRKLGKIMSKEQRYEDAIILFPKKTDVFEYHFEKLLLADQN